MDNLTPAGTPGEQPALHASRATLPAQFTEVVIASTLDMATQMVSTPDGRLFVCEAAGVVRVVKNDVLLSTPFATINPTVIESYGSRGLMGIALSPSFATDRYVYLAFTAKGSPLRNRIVRIRASTSNLDVAESSGGFVTIHNSFDLSPQGSTHAHNSMAMRFSGGHLYLATGDNQQQSVVQTETHSAGKILRMNADLTPVSTNPFAGDSNAWRARLWGKGMRNPWTMAVNNAGLLYVSDVGSFEGNGGTPNAGGVPVEEINIIPTSTPRTSAINYGWPSIEGGGANIIHTYPQAAETDVEGSDCAVVGGTFYEPNAAAFPSTPKFPPSYNGAYFFGDHCSKKIKYLSAGQQTPQTLNGNPPAASARTPVLFATGTLPGMLALEVSPNGALYYLSRNIIQPRTGSDGSVLVKITFAGTPIPETCNLTAPVNGARYTAPASFTMNVTAADATGDGIQKVEFFYTNTNIAGAPQVKVGEDTSAPYSLSLSNLQENAYRLVARCSNFQGGFKDSDLSTVAVNGPTAVIDNPVASLTYNGGDTINFSGTGSDLEDGSIPASRFKWFADLGHGIGAGAHFHDGPRFDGVTSGSFVIPRDDELDPNVFWRITLQVQDSAGIYHSVFRDIFPNKTDVTVTTSPPGLIVNVDGTDRVGPAPFLAVVGMKRDLVAPPQQQLNGRMYQFQSWSQGGAATQTWFVTNGNPTITASYQDIGPASPTLTSQDIGSVAATGTYNFNSGTSTYTIEGSGADIWNTADEFRFSHAALTGDGTITARVVSIENTNGFAKAGVMMRDGTGANARNVFTFVTPVATQGFRWQQRLSNGVSTTSAFASNATSGWVRVTRSGNNFTGQYSTDGVNWSSVGGVASIAMPATIRVGLAVTSHADGTLATGVFDNVSITTPAPPSPPGPPTGLVCTPGNNRCVCTWNAPAGGGATSYNLKRSITSGSGHATVASPTGTSHTDSTATNGTTYFYVVTAVNGAGQSGNSNQAQCKPLPDAPTNLMATAGDGQVSLSWTASSGATSYTVKRATASGGPYDDFIAPGITATSYDDTTASNGTTYFYVVTASDANSESGNSNEASATPQPPPEAPTDLIVTGGVGQAQLNWTDNSSIESLTRIERKLTAAPDTSFALINTVGANVTSYLDTPLGAGDYTWRVQAVNGSGGSIFSNSASAIVTVPSGPPPPSNLAATITGGNTANLTWADNSSNETGFLIERKVGANSYETLVTKAANSTSHADTPLAAGTYTYRVRANGSPNSAFSNEVVAIIVNPAADAYVRSGTNASNNYGTATVIDVKTTTSPDTQRNAFVRFSMAGVAATVTSARLRLYGNAATSMKSIGVFSVSNITWVESGTGGITWANQPAMGGTALTSLTVNTTAAYVEFDVTAYVQAQKAAGASAITLGVKAITASDEGQTTFNSKEGTNKPMLVIASKP